MSAARGDRKPCTLTHCSGTMQFGREPMRAAPGRSAPDGDRGWLCSQNRDHFQREVVRSAPEAQSSRGTWDDDGGAGGEGRSRELAG